MSENKKLKVLYISRGIVYSGAEIVTYNFAVNAPMIEPIFYSSSGKFADILKKNKVIVYVSRWLGSFGIRKNPLWWLVAALKYIMIEYELLKLIRKEKIDVIHVIKYDSVVYCILLKLLFNIPLVGHMHNFCPNAYLIKSMMNFMSRFVDRIIANSMAVKIDCLEKGMPREKLSVIYNGLNIEERKNKDIKMMLKLDSDVFVVAMAGMITPWKGFHIYLEAIKYLENDERIKNNVKYLIIGEYVKDDLYYIEDLKKYVLENNLDKKVIFTGRIDDLNAYLPSVNILVHASIEDEPFGMIIMEGMLAGAAVIGSNGGGVREIIDDAINGYICEPGNAKSLSELIASAIINYDSTKEMRNRAKDKMEQKFTLQKQINDICKLYEEISWRALKDENINAK